MTPLNHGDILRCTDTNEHLLLLKRVEREYGDGQMEHSWDMLDLLFDRIFWEWEFVLEDEVTYERLA